MTAQLHPPDHEPWSASAGGDETAFGRLFDRYARAVYNHAFRLTGSWLLAEDVTQATFLVAWRRRGDARLADGSALPWLLVVATNTVRTEWRSARRWRALLRRVPRDREAGADPADEVAARLDDERRMAPILAAVRRLPRAEREAVALCLWSGVPYAEAATALGIQRGSGPLPGEPRSGPPGTDGRQRQRGGRVMNEVLDLPARSAASRRTGRLATDRRQQSANSNLLKLHNALATPA